MTTTTRRWITLGFVILAIVLLWFALVYAPYQYAATMTRKRHIKDSIAIVEVWVQGGEIKR